MAKLRIVLLSLVVFLLASVPPPAFAVIGARVIPSTDMYGTIVSGGTTSGTAVSGTSTFYSGPTDTNSVKNPCYDLYWGAVTGTFTVQVSNKAKPVFTSDADWKAITLARPIAQPSGGASGDYVDLSGIPFKWVRLKYVNASGSGNIQAFLFGKD